MYHRKCSGLRLLQARSSEEAPLLFSLLRHPPHHHVISTWEQDRAPPAVALSTPQGWPQQRVDERVTGAWPAFLGEVSPLGLLCLTLFDHRYISPTLHCTVIWFDLG